MTETISPPSQPRMPAKRQDTGVDLQLLSISLFIILALLLANFHRHLSLQESDSQHLARTSELQLLSQQIVQQAGEASAGSDNAFGLLTTYRNEFTNKLEWLKFGQEEVHLPPTDAAIAGKELLHLASTWQKTKHVIDKLFATRTAVLNTSEQLQQVNTALPKIEAELRAVVDRLSTLNYRKEQILIAARQINLMEKMKSSLQRMQYRQEDTVQAATDFNQSAIQFNQVLLAMLQGNDRLGILRVRDGVARSSIQEIQGEFGLLMKRNLNLIEDAQQLAQARMAMDEVKLNSTLLLNDAMALQEAYQNQANQRITGAVPGVILGGLGFFLLILLSYRNQQRIKRRLRIMKAEKEERDSAVTQLQDEISNLAAGNLNVTATQDSLFTAPLAQSFNNVLETWRGIVHALNKTVISASSTSKRSEKITADLRQNSEEQTLSINNVASAINSMAACIERVSGNVKECGDVSEQAVYQSKNSILAMDQLSANMNGVQIHLNDSNLQINNLVVKTQEMGNLGTKLQDIAEQMSILALNASIHCSHLSDAEHGLAAVVNGLQRLAQQSAEVADQVEPAVSTLQQEVAEVQASMLLSAREFEKGLQLAKSTELTIGHTEQVCLQVADLVDEIFQAVGQQSQSANDIAKSMHLIENITTQTVGSVKETSSAVKQLADYIQKMNTSVAVFKLPEMHEEARV